ncbi:MAG TPA: dienelactone hydrolase family protein [Hyphomicrobiaceae bacterium]|jgi:carboxymethylenebutenolidase
MGARVHGIALAALVLLAQPCEAHAQAGPERVTFLSADGKTELVGYVFRPRKMRTPRVPGVVMMHGRAGAYSSAAGGVYDASTLSRRHLMWGRLWAASGYVGILVDGFGPRGHPQGFPRFSYRDRPPEFDETTVRPLDAYGALAYLRTRGDVVPDRIGLQGWSNGGSATLAAMAIDAPGISMPTPTSGFRAALAFYPACGLKGRFQAGYRPYAPVRVFHGTADEEVSPRRCSRLVERGRALGGDTRIELYDEATHGFDDPSPKRRRIPANAAAAEDAVNRALRFFAEALQSVGRVNPAESEGRK